jgi:hypothetical protein
MPEQSSQRILSVLSTPVSTDPPHLVLQRELARRQVTDGVAPPAAAVPTGSAPATDVGVYAIRNRITGRVYVSGDMDVQVGLDYDRAALNNKQHRNAALQADWDWFGADSFTFEVVARVEPAADRKSHGKLLQAVESSREQLGSYGQTGYNSRVTVPV